MSYPSPRATSPGHPATRPAETSRAPERSSPAPASGVDDDVPGHVAPTVVRRVVHEFRRCGVLPARGFAERPEVDTSLTGAYGRTLAMLLVALALVGCAESFDAVARRAIVTANDAQDGVARVYIGAKAATEDAGLRCGDAARATGRTPSPEVCSQLGVPLPYDPVKLNSLVGPVNAAYEAIRAADSTRIAVSAGTKAEPDLAVALTEALKALLRLKTAAADVGLALDGKKLDGAATALESASQKGATR